MSGALVVDFDGVVCDALEECALVTWLGVHGVDPDLPVSAYRRAVSPTFSEKFATVRNFSRTLDHFAVAHSGHIGPPRSRIEFDQRFDALSGDFLAAFVRRANMARNRCREEEPRFWLGMHSIYPGISDLLRRHTGRVHVITAKDAASVRSILRANGLGAAVSEIYGEVSAKDEVMLALCAEHKVEVTDTVFIDDNLTNVERVAAVGAQSHWAKWGYHTPEDIRKADGSEVRRLNLSDLPGIMVG